MMRPGLSLLEIIIATAVLAASAMVLVSLIGLGAKYGNRAEERTVVLSQAESLLDEYLAHLGTVENQDAQTGVLMGPPPRSFRISASPFDLGNSATSSATGQGAENRAGLIRVTVEMLESNEQGLSGESKPLVVLSRLVRRPLGSSGSSQETLPPGVSGANDLSLQGTLP